MNEPAGILWHLRRAGDGEILVVGLVILGGVVMVSGHARAAVSTGGAYPACWTWRKWCFGIGADTEGQPSAQGNRRAHRYPEDEKLRKCEKSLDHPPLGVTSVGMTTKHIQKLTLWATCTPEVRRIFAYVASKPPETQPVGTVHLAIEVASPRQSRLCPFSLWFFERSRFWAAIFNATPSDFQFALAGYYPECPEVLEDVKRTGKLVYSVEAVQ